MKTNSSIDDYIVELVSSGRFAFRISIAVKKKFNVKISRDTVIRRLKENNFKYRKKFKVPELNASQIFLRYNFSNTVINTSVQATEDTVFSDEARFSFRPDNQKFWIQNDDMSECATTQCRKFPIITMIWAAIGKNYKSKLVFIDNSINQERYREVIKESGIFNELDEKRRKWKYIFQQDGAT